MIYYKEKSDIMRYFRYSEFRQISKNDSGVPERAYDQNLPSSGPM